MSQKKSNLGTENIGKLLRQQSIPAAIGILSIAIYQVVDTIFVGNYVGTNAIAAITVVMPITFLISSIGMALGVGGASIISRALGADQEEHAIHTFNNLITLVFIIAFIAFSLGFFFAHPILKAFGGRGDIFPIAHEYFMMLLPSVPFLAWAMMSNNIIRAEGQATISMITMLIPGLLNIILDAIFIVGLGWGMKGAGLATALSYLASASFTAWYFFLSGRSNIAFVRKYLKPKWEIVRETFAIGVTTLARQGAVSILTIVLNNTLFNYGGELSVAVYGIISRLMMFIFFPIFGLVQGSLPIIGFNYGANQYKRVRQTLSTALIYSTILCFMIFVLIFLFSDSIIRIFTQDAALIEQGSRALKMVFLAATIIGIQALGAAYFQAIGKAVPALLLTLSRQGFFLIPLILVLPLYFDIDGVWYSFPIADVLSMVVTLIFLYPQWAKLNKEPVKSMST